ncbi:MAG: 50S ribosomal protein L7/L12 [Gammaproteobacteria bacterium]
MALSKEEILDAISEMSVMDIVDLISAMEEKFGVTAAAPVAAAVAAPAGGDAGAGAEEEAGPVELFLAEVGDKKVDVIKAVRAITGLGLKDAKGLVDGAPSSLKEGVDKAEAEEYVKQLEEAGAKAELK